MSEDNDPESCASYGHSGRPKKEKRSETSFPNIYRNEVNLPGYSGCLWIVLGIVASLGAAAAAWFYFV